MAAFIRVYSVINLYSLHVTISGLSETNTVVHNLLQSHVLVSSCDFKKALNIDLMRVYLSFTDKESEGRLA